MPNEEFYERMRKLEEQSRGEAVWVYPAHGNRRQKIQLVKVHKELTHTTGTYVKVGDQHVVMLGEREIQNPSTGFRYHEFKTPGRTGFCRRNI